MRHQKLSTAVKVDAVNPRMNSRKSLTVVETQLPAIRHRQGSTGPTYTDVDSTVSSPHQSIGALNQSKNAIGSTFYLSKNYTQSGTPSAVRSEDITEQLLQQDALRRKVSLKGSTSALHKMLVGPPKNTLKASNNTKSESGFAAGSKLPSIDDGSRDNTFFLSNGSRKSSLGMSYSHSQMLQVMGITNDSHSWQPVNDYDKPLEIITEGSNKFSQTMSFINNLEAKKTMTTGYVDRVSFIKSQKFSKFLAILKDQELPKVEDENFYAKLEIQMREEASKRNLELKMTHEEIGNLYLRPQSLINSVFAGIRFC